MYRCTSCVPKINVRADGQDHKVSGSLKKIDANTIEETAKRNGKVIGILRMTVAADGKTMSANREDKLEGVTVKWTAEKQ